MQIRPLSLTGQAVTTHNLEKLANNALSDINIENIISNSTNETNKLCKQNLSWKNDQFWKDLPEPNLQIKQKLINNNEDFKQPKSFEPCLLSICRKSENQPKGTSQTNQNTHVECITKLTRKFFDRWKYFTRMKMEHRNELQQQIDQKEKLDNFLKRLKRFQNNKSGQCNSVTKLECNPTAVEESSLANCQSKTPDSSCYKHRFEAQQTIIQIQKHKLVQQEKVIQELRLGTLSKEINQSLEETEKEIRETLSKCSLKVKSKMGPTFKAENIEDETMKFQINSEKAPKIAQQMEKRALEREERRQMILEKKRLIDKLRKEAIQMDIERKKVLDEEERKRHIREIKEHRKKEMEIQQLKQIRKQKFLESCEKADKFYKRRLTRFAFRGFVKLIIIKEDNEIKSEIFYEKHLKKVCWRSWKIFVTDMQSSKITKAEQFYKFNLKRSILKAWQDTYTVSIQHLQVAEDLYEFRLQSRLFIKWRKYMQVQCSLENCNLQNAEIHYNSRTLLHYFYQWKLLPAVVKLEKEKEEKKRKWREKVWEILPDYTPVVDD